MPKRPTVYDVAKAAGVSIATVSFTFRQPERVRPATREAVLAAARSLDYVPSASARGLADGRTGALGLFSYDMLLQASRSGPRTVEVEKDGAAGTAQDDPFAHDADAEDFTLFPLYVDEVQRGFELECARRGRALLIGRGAGEGAGGVLDVASRVDGLAVFPAPNSAEVLAQLSRRLPVVAFAMPDGGGLLHHVRVDNVAGTTALVEHLVRVHGHRRVEFVGAPQTPDYADRLAGLQQALGALGLPVPPGALDPTPLQADDPFPVVRSLAASGDLPDALVCASDQHALALLETLRRTGIRVPDDVAVTGFDGVVAGRLATPALTTVRQPMEEMGRRAVDVLLGSLDDPDGARADLTLPVRLLVRGSCGCRYP